MKIIVIGGGIGGLAAANLLARDGHTVHVIEKNSWLGGRAGRISQDGFTFDTGPSWYLMPEVFERYFDRIGVNLADSLPLTRLSPAYKVFFEQSPPIVVTSDLSIDAATFETIEPGAGDRLQQYVAQSNDVYRLSIEHFLYANFHRTTDLLNRNLLTHGRHLAQLALTPLHKYVARRFKDKRLQQILEYPMVFLGTSPFVAPALYSLMSALDFNDGVYYPQGGMYGIIELLANTGKHLGVAYHLNSPVGHIETRAKRARAVTLESGDVLEADIIISNADLHFTETTLLDPNVRSYPERYWARKEAGPSALLLYLGIKGSLPELEHHNLLFVDAWKENFADIYTHKRAPDTASIYIGRASATDPTVAPPGHENVFVLIPLPAGEAIKEMDIPHLTRLYLAQIKHMTGVDLSKHIVTQAHFTPQDFSATYHTWQSSMLGQSHRLSQSAFFRTKNKSKKLDNLYYVGANTLPGIGLPMCLISAELVADRIAQEHAA